MNTETLLNVANNENTSAETLDVLAKLGGIDFTYVKIHQAVARHKNTSEATLAFLATNGEWQVCDDLLANENTSPYVIAKMATEGNWEARLRLSLSDKVSSDILAIVVDREINGAK